MRRLYETITGLIPSCFSQNNNIFFVICVVILLQVPVGSTSSKVSPTLGSYFTRSLRSKNHIDPFPVFLVKFRCKEGYEESVQRVQSDKTVRSVLDCGKGVGSDVDQWIMRIFVIFL